MITPPTDSLYKFIAIAGVVLIVWGVSVPWDKQYEYETSRAKYVAQKQKLQRMVESYKLRLQDIANEMRGVVGDELKPFREEVASLNKDMEEANASITEAGLVVSVMQKAADTYRLVGLLSQIAGVVMIVVGFLLWYLKLQRHVDRKFVSDDGKKTVNNGSSRRRWRRKVS